MVTRAREVETKYDVDGDVDLPDLTGVAGVAQVSGPDLHELDATYFDTEDLRLARAGITLRRRVGGDDEGWHLKLPAEGARHELRTALGRSTRTVPIALRRVVTGVTRGAPLLPVASLRTERRVVSLVDGDDAVLALLCDDRVRARDLRLEDDDELTWREWELELHDGGPKLAKIVEKRLRKAGARTAEHPSKLARALHTSWVVPDPPEVVASKRTSERDLLQQHLAALTGDLERLDPLVRADLPDAVHQMRVRCRRLRGILSSFKKSFDTTATRPVRDDLKWLVRELGRPRDLEVQRERLDDLFAAEQPDLVRGHARRWTGTQLKAAHRTAHRQGTDAMESPRYAALIDVLEGWAAAPPWSDRKDKPALTRLPRRVAREWDKTEKAATAAEAAAGTADHVDKLHDVRRAARRTRYAAEALAPVVGKDASRLASKVEAIQDALGEHHDTAVAGDQVVKLADAARTAGQDTFSYGVLRARLDLTLTDNEKDYQRAWRKARKEKLRDWLG